MRNNEPLQKLMIKHNSIGGESFHEVALVIETMQHLTYLDIGFNRLNNSNFYDILFPVSRNKTKLEELHCRGNEIGGHELD